MNHISVFIQKIFSKSALLFLILFTGLAANAQEKIDTAQQQIDSARLTKFNTDSVKKYFKASDTLIAYQLNKIEKYTIDFNKINNRLRRGFDTSAISEGLPESDSIISIANKNLTGFRGHTSLKILSTTKTFLEQQQKILARWQDDLSAYNTELNSIKDKMTMVKKDSNLLIMPSDSLLFLEYLKKLKPLGTKITDADSITTLQLKSLGILQNDVSTNYLAVTDLLDEAAYQINNFSNRIFENEFGYIWEYKKDPSYEKNFHAVAKTSLQESKTLVGFYSDSNWASRIIVLAIAFLFYFWMRRCIRKIRRQSEAPELVFEKANHVPRHLLASTIVFSLLLIPFIYKTAPQAFTQSIWGLQIIALAILIRQKLSFSLGIQILILLSLFYVTGFTNLLIETTYSERWIQLFISGVSVFLGVWLLLSKKENHFSKAGFYKPLTWIFVVMNFAALLLNMTGRVTLAKVLNTGANYGMIEALNLLIFVEIIIDALYLTLEAGKKTSRLTAFFQFKGMEQRMRKGFGFFAGLIWIVIFAQNLHIYDAIFGNISEFLSKERQIGSLTFTFMSIVIFGLIIWLTTMVSQMVSFIYSGAQGSDDITGKSKIGSTILLVRLAIYSAGVLLAFGASGIPLDKLAIVIGALGVGIGFGLQNIVNNLVSGIVLAFEKPVQIGDTIEVGSLSGIVQEVGIRSSKLRTFDGSEVIIPNGDMLSQHLINWTKNNDDRRVTLPIGVAYGSNIDKVKAVILELLESNKDVYENPAPVVVVKNFGDNAVDLTVYFWADINKWFGLKSEMLGAIYDTLNKEGIGIPFPQRDLHIKSIDNNLLKDLKIQQQDFPEKSNGEKHESS